MMKKIGIVIIVFGGLALAGLIFIWNRPSGSPEDIRVGPATVRAEIVSAPAEMEKGLSGRESLPADAGMLFVIDPAGQPAFWMKDMKMPLDLVYLRSGRVVEVKENVSPPSFGMAPEPFAPNSVCDRVLEVNAGWVKTHGIKVGDTAEY